MKSLYIPLAGLLLSVLVSVAGAGQRGLQKLTVGYAPVSGAALPLFIAIEEKLFQKYGYDVSGIFMGSSQLINTALLTGELLLGYAGGGGVISSRLAGSDLVAIASPLPVLTIDGWAKPEIKSLLNSAESASASPASAHPPILPRSRCSSLPVSNRTR